MYETAQYSNSKTRVVGIVTATALTFAFGYALAEGMNLDITPKDERAMEMVIITPPPVKPVEEIKKVEKPIEAPPAAPELVAPEIDFVVETLPVMVAPVAEPAPVPDPIPAAPAPAVGTDRIAPKLNPGAKPAYPPAALRAGEQGATHLRVCVNPQGRVTSVNIAGTSGSQRLDDAAAKWLHNERFTPGKIGGVAQAMCDHDVYYKWNLQDAGK